MCGIAGYFLKEHSLEPVRTLRSMGSTIQHRGPDACSVWHDESIGLVHQRLSIIDLSEAGTQPMTIGDYTIVFNGEIYNYKELREGLISEGIQFATQTDTEVLLQLFIKKGKKSLNKLNGMFAFSIWNKAERSLFIARDRLGKKPFYYYQSGNDFAFASEIKAFSPLSFIKKEIRSDAIKDYFFYQYVPDPKTIYKNIYKLKPGHCAAINVDTPDAINEECYWDLQFSTDHSITESQASEELYALIDDATKLRMKSDVPLGAFLSGGIDSSAVVGMMSDHSPKPVNTCAIGFNSKKYDEVEHAEQVARHFGTNHHELTVEGDVADSFETITKFFDEPFSDPSYIPTYYVANLARQKVTVALAGDGGDESFAGYNKYTVDKRENRIRQWIPQQVQNTMCGPLSKTLKTLKVPGTKKASSLLSTLSKSPGEAFFVTNTFFDEHVWDWLISDSFDLQTRDYKPSEITRDIYNDAPAEDHLGKVLYTDLKTYLPGDILTKVDRMTMANSLEARAPLLDYRVVEYAAKLPSKFKLNGTDKKYILKQTLTKRLPREILDRKKMGFSVPLAQWLRNQLKEKVICLPQNENLCAVFNKDKLEKLVINFMNGSNRYTHELWSMIVFCEWSKNYG